MLDSNNLYSDYAELYAIIADDRDFVYELTKMEVLKLDSSSTFVELFAGPAYHSTTLKKMGWDGKIIAIDSSKAMEDVAKKRGFFGNYICSDAISGLSTVTQAQVICIPRYSIVLVDHDYVKQLFYVIANALCSDGFFFIEIHKDTVVNEQAKIHGNWERLGIYRREVKNQGRSIECLWPFTTKAVDIEKNIVDMSVKITSTNDSGKQDEFIFTSREHLHSRTTLDNFASEARLVPAPDLNFDTSDGNFIAYQKKSDSAADSDYFKTLGKKALNRIFDLSTNETQSKLIEKSGLDVEHHDSPLSLHVYNLL